MSDTHGHGAGTPTSLRNDDGPHLDASAGTEWRSAGRVGTSPEQAATALAIGTAMPHDCDPNSVSAAEPRNRRSRHKAGSGRLMGVDVARGLAIIAMVMLHVLPPATPDGELSLAWRFSVWNAAALFALVSGVAMALSSGRTRPPRGRIWAGAAAALTVRAVGIGAIGLLLGYVVPVSRAIVILPYFAVLFLLAIPLLRLPVPVLAGLTAALAVGVPFLSQAVRADLPAPTITNPTFADLLADPQGLLVYLLLTGVYPALPYLTYVCAGLAIGRARLSARGVVSAVTVAGILLAVAASAVSWYLMDLRGGRLELEAVALENMSLERYVDLLIWGANGTVPTSSEWWLAVLAPNSGTPVDLLFTLGVGMAILGLCITLGRVIAPILSPLAILGSMSLSIYVIHLLLLSAPFITARDGGEFVFQMVLLFAFALVWHGWFSRGPLEQVLHSATVGVRRPFVRSARRRAGRTATPVRHAAPLLSGSADGAAGERAPG